MENLVALFGSLVGVGALIAALINVGKVAGWVKDGTAPTWSTGLNLLGLLILFVLGLFKPDVDLVYADQVAGQVANIMLMVTGLVVQLLSSRATHSALKGTKVLGASYSLQQSAVMKAQASAFINKAMQRE